MIRFTLVCVAAGLLAMTAGCDLFSTREAEPPDGGRRTWQTPRQPGDVLDNMRAALSERDAVNYLRSFESSSFRFEADPVAQSHDPFLADWGYAEESKHISRLLSEGTLPRDSVLSLFFIAPEVTMLGDSALIRAGYELEAGVALAGVPHRVAGTADFRLSVGGESYWQIHYWRDTRTEGEATWSDFKSLVR